MSPKKDGAPGGPLILDENGEVVWFLAVQPEQAAHFRVQEYRGENVLTWWQGTQPAIGIGDGRFVTAAYVEPFVAPEIEQGYEGHWIDVNLTGFYAIAYDSWNPRYAAIITAGRGERTPKGVFEILYRVRSETMDSATVDIPPGHPEYYYLENVEFTQYFKYGGYAIHGNYWTEPQNFGAFSSNGCVGLMNRDAEWFWNYLDVGSTVSIHF
jgi:hypothetical protein